MKSPANLGEKTAARLGRKSPEFVWLEIQAAWCRADTEQPATVAYLCRSQSADPEVLIPTLSRKYYFNQILNHMAAENPKLNFCHNPDADPLDVVRAVLNAVAS